MNKLKIICDGDSWVFGCEIVDPNIISKYDKDIYVGRYDYLEENDNYRIPRIFSSYIKEKMNVDIVNLSWPADDNGTILNRIMTYITKEYLNKKISTDDIFVIVGWSSPERNFFWYKDEKISHRFRLWPQVPIFETQYQKEFWELYVTYLWNPEEYIPRYVMNVLQFQNFCNSNNIKWLCFNSFYQVPGKSPSEWFDLDIKTELIKLKMDGTSYYDSNKNGRCYHSYEYLSMWNLIDDTRFYKKDMLNNTFKSFIEEKNITPVYNGWHPSPESHEIWAEEIIEYINKNNLIK